MMKVLDKNRNFLGLPDEFSGFKQARVVILPVPYERTSSYVDGSKKGPEALLEASSQLEDFDEELNTVIYRCCKGIATLEPMQFASETAPESIERIRQVVSGLLEMGKYVVSLGGEHTFSLGPVRAHYDHYGDSLSLLQLDAHKDFRDDYLGDPFSHASVMARMLEFIPSIVQLGIRSHCREELEIQHADRVSTFYAHSIKSGQMPDWQEQVLEALDKVLRPAGILLRADSSIRKLEGLDSYQQVIGNVPEELTVKEHGLSFAVSLREGQKTGWFYDQRLNRARLRNYVRGKRVLDVFSYAGAWGLQAAAAGAAEVLCVDASGAAVERIHGNAQANGLSDRVASVEGDAFEVLAQLRLNQEKFDVVVLDPPAFIKRKKDARAGEQAYHRLNQLAMQVLKKDAILVSASCSHHLPESSLQTILLQSSRHLDRSLQILERGHQAPDHPLHPAIAETAYLKALFCRVLPS